MAPLPKRCMLKIFTVLIVLGPFEVLNQLLRLKIFTSWIFHTVLHFGLLLEFYTTEEIQTCQLNQQPST